MWRTIVLLIPLAQLPAQQVSAAVKAYRAKDYAKFLECEQRGLNRDPQNPRLAYNVACGQALVGEGRKAVELLDQLLARNLDMGADSDEDFSKIRATAEWKAFAAKLATLREPVVRSEVAFRLEDPGLMSTGIAVDPETGDTYIASVRERKIVRRTKEGVTSDWIAPAQDGFLAGASLAFDATRRLLYASTATAPFMLGHSAADEGKSAVFVFAVQSGKLVRRVFLPPDGKPHFLNALLLERGGDVYVSDSATSGIYRLGRDASELETFVAPGVFASTQGLAFSDDEKTMYIADYSSGVWAMDVATKIRRKVATPAGEWLGGLDGLTRLSDGFLAVQVGVRPERVLRLRMDRQWQRIDAVEILEMNHPDYAGPVQGVLAGDAFLYIANSQLPLANAPEKAKPTTVLRLPV